MPAASLIPTAEGSQCDSWSSLTQAGQLSYTQKSTHTQFSSINKLQDLPKLSSEAKNYSPGP